MKTYQTKFSLEMKLFITGIFLLAVQLSAQELGRPHIYDVTPKTALVINGAKNIGTANWGLSFKLKKRHSLAETIFSHLNLPKNITFYSDTMLLADLEPEQDYELKVSLLKQNGTKWDTLNGESTGFTTGRFLVQTDRASRAILDSVTLHAVVMTPVHNPASFGQTAEQRMYIRFSYGLSNDSLQQTKTGWKEIFANPKSARITIADSIRVSGLQSSKEYFYRAEYAIGTATEKNIVASARMQQFISSEGIAVRSGKISYNTEKNSVSIESTVSIYKENFQGKILFQYWKIPFLRGADMLMQHSFDTRMSMSELRFIKNRIPVDPDFKNFSEQNISSGSRITKSAEFTMEPRSLYAVRALIYDEATKKSYYLPADVLQPGSEENSFVHLAHSVNQESLGLHLLQPFIDEKSKEIFVGAILTKNSSDQLDHQPFIRLYTSTSPVFSDDHGPDVRIGTRNNMNFGFASIGRNDYRPYTKYYFNVAYHASNGNILRSDTVTFTTPSIAGLEMQRVETIQETNILPKFTAGMKVNDAGGTVYFEYGTSEQYGLKSPVIHIDTKDKRDHYVVTTTGIQGLQPHAIYYYRTVLYDSATKQTFYGPKLSFFSSIDASLGYEWFVQGMKGVKNTFSLPKNLGSLVKAEFQMSTATGAETIIDNKPSDGLTATFDMGDAYPGATVSVRAFNNAGDTVIKNFRGKLGIIARPGWLPDNGSVSVDATNRIITYNPVVKMPFPDLMRTVGGGIKFFGNKSMSASGFQMPMDIIYHYSTRQSEINLPQLHFSHSQDSKVGSMSADLSGQVFLDSSFNLLIETSLGVTGPSFWVFGETATFNFEDGLVEGELSTGISVTPVFNLDLLVGNMNGWGLVQSEGKTSYFDAGLSFYGGVTGSLSVCEGVGSVDASLGVTAPVLLGMAFANKPTEYKSFIWGGDVTVAGEIAVKACGIKVFDKTKTFYEASWGTIPAVVANGGKKGSTALLGEPISLANSIKRLDIPDFNPMMSIGEKDSTLGIVWMDDVDSKNGKLFFSQINFNGNSLINRFDKPLTIVEHGFGMSQPMVSLTDNHSAFITWTQSRYNDDNFDNNISLYDYFISQDIWGAYYDSGTKSITSIFRINDDTTNLSSGRLEGKPDIISLSGNSAMLTWTGGEAYQRQSDIWYSLVTVNGNSVQTSEPQMLTDLEGENKNVRVHSIGQYKAVAVWLNNPDNLEDVRDNRVVTAFWNGSSWSAQILLPELEYVNYTDIALDFTNGKGILAITRMTTDSADGIGVNELILADWNATTNVWDIANAKIYRDTSYVFRIPSVSISNKGIAAVTVQHQQLFRPTVEEHHMGDIDLYMRNLENNSEWRVERNNSFLTDTSTFEWELDGGFMNGNTYVTITQERDTIESGYHVPVQGVRFGKEEQELVLRAFTISDNLTLTDASEPQNTTGIENNFSDKNSSEAIFASCYPNPFTAKTNIIFETKENSFVTVEIFDMLGNSVAKLAEENFLPGRHALPFNSEGLSNGIYTCLVKSKENSASIKLIVNK